MKTILIVALASVLSLSACVGPNGFNSTQRAPAAESVLTRNPQIEALAVESLRAVQVQSYAEEREYCGWIYYSDDGLQATETVRGNLDSCRMPEPPAGAVVLASFHTHGSHDINYFSEVPSTHDVVGDYVTNTLGYISTPGGRVWVVDSEAQRLYQVCGEYCLPHDPNYRTEDYGPIPSEMSIRDLYQYFQDQRSVARQ